MADDFEMAEDEELYDVGEADDEEGDDETEDEEAYVQYSPRLAAQSFGAPRFPMGAYPYPTGLRDRRLRGVKAGFIRTRQGTAIIRMPTPVATIGGVRVLGRRSRRAEAALTDHERRLRAFERSGSRQGLYAGGAVALQMFRDVNADVRNRLNNTGDAARFLPGVDYGLSALQTAMVVGAIPPSRRSALLWSLPFTTGVLGAVGRELARPLVVPVGGVPAGVVNRRTPLELAVNVAVPALVGGISAIALQPRRPRLYVRF